MLVVVFHSFLFFILLFFFICCCFSLVSRLLCHATCTPPWLLRPVKASTTSELYPGYFRLTLLFSSTMSATALSRHFLATDIFYLTLLPRYFLSRHVFINASLGAGSSSLKFAGLHDAPRNTVQLFVRFTAIHNLHIQKNSFLNSTKYYHELLVVKV